MAKIRANVAPQLPAPRMAILADADIRVLDFGSSKHSILSSCQGYSKPFPLKLLRHFCKQLPLSPDSLPSSTPLISQRSGLARQRLHWQKTSIYRGMNRSADLIPQAEPDDSAT